MNMAKAILVQILGQNKDLLPYLYHSCISSGQVTLTSPQLCKELLEVALKSLPKSYIIVDGLDECSIAERKMMISILTSTIGDSSPGSLRGLFISQDENDIRRLLQQASSIRISENDNKEDIRKFSDLWAQRIQDKFELAQENADYISTAVLNGAEGEPNLFIAVSIY